MLLSFVGLYLLGTVLLGFWASRRVKNVRDFAVAGRQLGTVVAGSALFATWFGAETLLGAPGEFVGEEGGVLSIIEDPLGAALCLFVFGWLVARPLYRLNLLTFNDYYRIRYGRTIELVSAVALVPSFLSWIAAQMLALAQVLSALSGMSLTMGIVLCAVVVVLYTFVGGMWAVSITDFVQTVMILIGILALAWELASAAGGVSAVLTAQPSGFYRPIPHHATLSEWLAYVAAWITVGLGSVPGQDIFQRANSAKSEAVAVRSCYLGGFMYLTFGCIPLFIALCIKQLHPEMLHGETEQLLPQICLRYSSLGVQILFFGALLSAILSTTSGALLAPATVVGENLIKPLRPGMSDAQLLLTMRIAVLVLAAVSAWMATLGASIFELVGAASAVTLVSLFVPLMAGLYWPRASSLGAMLAIVSGLIVWSLTEFVWPVEGCPSLILGTAVSALSMVFGSRIAPRSIAAA
jgi:solute:Na+ symporter, SSS family